MRVRRLTVARLLAGVAAAVAVGSCARAEEAVAHYGAAFFAASQPTSAYDMIQKLPGFRLQEGDADLRGYAGAAGNVLLDGRPLSSKETTLEDLLKSIPATDVDRIDVIRSAAAGFDMQGYPLLANVVRRATAHASGRIEGQYARFDHGFSAPRVAADLSLRRGARTLDLQGAIYREIDDEHGFGRRDRYAAGGAPLRLTRYAQPEGANLSEGSFAYGQPIAGGDLRVTGLVKDRRMFADIAQDIYFPRPALTVGVEREHTTAIEEAVRYDRALGAANRLELLASRRDTRLRGSETSRDASGGELTRAASEAAETIARAVLRRKGQALSLEFGAEGALNSLESRIALFENDVGIPLPAANVRIEETRGEVFAGATWRPRPWASVEAGMRFETSRLSQSGDSQLSRSFSAFKPRLLARLTSSARDELRLLLVREMGQLDFEDFVSNASVTSGVITAGNRNLQPESLWRAEAAWERRVGAGAFVLTARNEWISHLIDRIAVASPEGIFDSVGNVGEGRRRELEADANLPMDGLGLTGLTVRASGVLRRTRTTDPLTGAGRRISGEAPFEGRIGFTQDLPVRRLRFGATYVAETDETKFKIDEIEEDRLAGRLDAWVELKPEPHWTVRIFGANLTDTPATRVRAAYEGLRPASPLEFREIRALRCGRYFGFKVQREFGG